MVGIENYTAIYDFLNPKRILRATQKVEPFGITIVIEYINCSIVATDGKVFFSGDWGNIDIKDWVLFDWIKKIVSTTFDDESIMSLLISGAIATYLLQQGDIRIVENHQNKVKTFLKFLAGVK